MFSKAWLADTGERVLATYIEAWLGAMLTVAVLTDMSSLSAAAVSSAFAAIPAALSFLKSAIAKRYGNPDSASFVK
jgi:hypothetical protein